MTSDLPSKHREEDIALAIELGGRENGFMLLCLASAILAGKVRPSPALAKWFACAVSEVEAGASADQAFAIAKKRGPDPLKTLEERAKRDSQVLSTIDARLQEGYKTSANSGLPSVFEIVGDDLGISEGQVRAIYYEWETVENTIYTPISSN
jgi:hypothetical protein